MMAKNERTRRIGGCVSKGQRISSSHHITLLIHSNSLYSEHSPHLSNPIKTPSYQQLVCPPLCRFLHCSLLPCSYIAWCPNQEFAVTQGFASILFSSFIIRGNTIFQSPFTFSPFFSLLRPVVTFKHFLICFVIHQQ